MKIEKSGCCAPCYLSWSECCVGQVYEWKPTGKYYMKTNTGGCVNMDNGAFTASFHDSRNWIHVPNAKLVV